LFGSAISSPLVENTPTGKVGCPKYGKGWRKTLRQGCFTLSPTNQTGQGERQVTESFWVTSGMFPLKRARVGGVRGCLEAVKQNFKVIWLTNPLSKG
jgi:hypothetical protein